MATLTGFTRPADPIIADDLSAQITTEMGSSCEAIVIDASNVTVIGASISESNRTQIQAVITAYVYTGGSASASDATLTVTDITTNNVSTSKHGFFPKTPTSSGKFLKDDMTWATISGKLVIGTGGTIIPAVGLSVAAAAVVGVDSSFRIWKAGTNTVQSYGNWS